MKPVLLLDMDGPLAGFDIKFWDACIERGLTFDVEGPGFQAKRFFTDHIPDRRERNIAHKMIQQPGWFAELPVVPGSQEGVDKLILLGFDIWVCTKPMESNPTCHSDKAQWIARHFPKLTNKLMIVPDKSMVHGDILLDDAPKVEWIPQATWKPILFTTPFNHDESEWAGLPRWTWSDPIGNLLAHVEELNIHA